MSKAQLRRVSAARPCPVCGGSHKCSLTDDGLILCGREAKPVAGFRDLGPSDDPTWHLYRPEDPAGMANAPGGWKPAPAVKSSPPTDFGKLAERLGRGLSPTLAGDLAERLGLPASAVSLIPNLGFDPNAGCWAIPEHDAQGHVIGIGTRFRDGSKRAAPGSRRGLVLPSGWADNPGPVLVVEGMSDAVALAHCGLCAVGRPSARGGVELLAALLGGGVAAGRPVFVLGENDRKPDGTWPGRDGAAFVAAALSKALGRAVLTACPPEQYKDAREWVTDRLKATRGGGDPEPELAIGRDIAAMMARGAAAAAQSKPAPRADRFPLPLPLDVLATGPAGGGVPWVWDGYLMRGGVTLLSALPKCGKTTLLSHLFKTLSTGGSFCGRPLVTGRALVVSEESPEVWAERRDRLGLTGCVRLLSRPFFTRPSADDWSAFLLHLANVLAHDPADLVVFDTLADLWPVKDENNATDVQGALQPVRRLADGRAVLLVHHLRKSDGGEGTGSRGSGALAGFVDVLVELRRAGRAADPGGAKRVLTAVGRATGVPPEWAVELDEEAGVYRGTDMGDPSALLTEAIRKALFAAGPEGLTQRAVGEVVPAGLQRGERQLRDTLCAGAAAGDWGKEDRAGRRGGPVYRVGLPPIPAGKEVVTEGVLFDDLQTLPD